MKLFDIAITTSPPHHRSNVTFIRQHQILLMYVFMNRQHGKKGGQERQPAPQRWAGAATRSRRGVC